MDMPICMKCAYQACHCLHSRLALLVLLRCCIQQLPTGNASGFGNCNTSAVKKHNSNLGSTSNDENDDDDYDDDEHLRCWGFSHSPVHWNRLWGLRA